MDRLIRRPCGLPQDLNNLGNLTTHELHQAVDLAAQLLRQQIKLLRDHHRAAFEDTQDHLPRIEASMASNRADKVGAEVRKLKAKEDRLKEAGQADGIRADELDRQIRVVHGEYDKLRARQRKFEQEFENSGDAELRLQAINAQGRMDAIQDDVTRLLEDKDAALRNGIVRFVLERWLLEAENEEVIGKSA